MIKVCCDPYEDERGANFGDMLSLELVKELSGQEVQRVSLSNVMHSDMVCAGSILEYVPEEYTGYIWERGLCMIETLLFYR